MIPKKIHYIWFGNSPLPDLTLKCIESWKKFCPDYKIIKWDEKNFNVNINNYAKEAYEEKKYAFVSDYARIDIIYNYGGIYFDTDVEIIKNIDELLKNDAFIGTEKEGQLINPGSGFGAIKNHKFIKEMLDFYNKLKFINEDGIPSTALITTLLTPLLIKKGWKQNNTKQIIDSLTIYPTEYFCPIDYNKNIKITKNTFSIHHFTGTWVDKTMKKDFEDIKKIEKIFGKKITIYIWYLIKIYRRKGIIHIFKRFPFIIKKYIRLRRKK